MRRVARPRLTGLGFVVLLLLADLGLGLASPLLPGTTADQAEPAWGTQGTRILFADDLSDATARHYESRDHLPDGRPFDYYGGAVPEAGTSQDLEWRADRWRNDPLRWGAEGSQQLTTGEMVSLVPWVRSASTWHLGPDPGSGAYPSSVMGGVITPIVDLRGVSPLPPSASAEAGVNSLDAIDAFEGASPFTLGNTGNLVLNPLGAIQTDLENNAGPLTPVVQPRERAEGIRADDAPLQSAAALRLRHAYGFAVEGEMFIDGGRIEASAYDALHGKWGDWEGLEPTPRTLQVGGGPLEGRPFEATVDARVPGRPDANIGGRLGGSAEGQAPSAEADAWVKADPFTAKRTYPSEDTRRVEPSTLVTIKDAAVTPSADFDFPWLYRGTVEASQGDPLGGPWRGFGATSEGWVESVFDLTPYAGSILRFRFLAATANPLSGSVLSTPGLGWVIDEMEVRAAGSPQVSVIDLAFPGDGAVLSGDARDFRPVVALQNEFPMPVSIAVSAALEGGPVATDESRVQAGPRGRVLHHLADSFGDLLPEGQARNGLHRLGVAAVPILDGNDAFQGAVTLGGASTRTFHLQFGGGQAWQALFLMTEVIPLGEASPDFDAATRLVNRGQQMRIHATLENRGPDPLHLDLKGTDADVRPVIRRLDGAPEGTFVATSAGGKMNPDVVVLPPSRTGSGAAGAPQAAKDVVWTWSGTRIAQPLTLFLEDGAGRVVREGGRIRIESMEPASLDVDLGNRWEYEGGCNRNLSLLNHTGVLHCRDLGEVTSSATNLSAVQLLDGGQLGLRLAYRGAGNVTLLGNTEVDPQQAPPPLGPGWATIANASLPASEGWTRQTLALGELPKGWSGWLRISFATVPGQDLMVDEARLDVGPTGKAIPVAWHTLDTDFFAEENRLLPATEALLAKISVDPAQAAADPTSATRSTVTLKETIHPTGARPTLHLRSWLGQSVGYLAGIEAQPVPAVPSPQEPDWMPLVEMDASASREAEMTALQVPLWDFVNRPVRLRFVYEATPAAALVPLQDVPGWVIGDVRITQEGVAGSQTLHALRDFAEQYDLAGNVELSVAFDGPPRILPGTPEEPKVRSVASVPVSYTDRMTFDWTPFDCTQTPAGTYDLGPTAITDPVDLRAMDQPVLLLDHGGYAAKLRQGIRPLFMDLEYQILAPDGTWGRWASATAGTLKDPDGNPVHDMVENQTAFAGEWPAPKPGGGQPPPASRVVDELSLAPLVGHIVRFRFHQWVEVNPLGTLGCQAEAYWDVYGIKILEPVHLADAAVVSVSTSLDDSPILDRLAPAAVPGRANAAVLAVDGQTFEIRVQTANAGRLALTANVSLHLDAPGSLISFIDTSGPSPVPITGRSFGPVHLEPGATITARFRVELPGTPPGRYAADAQVRATDAVDTNPGNNLGALDLVVQPLRALTADRDGTSVRSFIGAPDAERTVELLLRNEGNVRESSLDVHAQVVEFTGLTQTTPLGYLLPTKSISLTERTGEALLRWDLPGDQGGILRAAPDLTSTAGIPLQLVHGTPSGIGDLQDVTAVRLRPDAFGSQVPRGAGDFAYSLHNAETSDQVALVVHPGEGVPTTVALDADGNGRLSVGDLVLAGDGPGEPIQADEPTLPGLSSESTAATGWFTYADANGNGRYDAGDPLYVSHGGEGRLAAPGPQSFTVRLSPGVATAGPAGAVVAQDDPDLTEFQGKDLPLALTFAAFDGTLAERLRVGRPYAVEFRVVPAPGSVTQWWNQSDPTQPLPVVAAGQADLTDDAPELIDITDFGKCQCIRAAFRVEGLLLDTDLDGGLSQVPTFPATAPWEAQTLVEENGQFVPTDRDDLPHWEFVGADNPSLPLEGGSGKVWSLPGYRGLEAIEATLTSPILPAHVIKSTSQAFLDLRYASDLNDGQGVLETRRLVGGHWTEWEPIDAARSQRIAVVLAPDFPRVTSAPQVKGSWMADSTAVAGLGAVGTSAAPEVFAIGSTRYLVSGQANGEFTGFRWDSSQANWVSDPAIVAGLPDVGSSSALTVFRLGPTMHLIAANSVGHLSGHAWDPTQQRWVPDPAVTVGLGSLGAFAVPEVFAVGSTTYLLGVANPMQGFRWNGSAWEPDAAIVTGLEKLDSRAAPTVFHLGGTPHLVIAWDAQLPTGYVWTGSGWAGEPGVAGLVFPTKSIPVVFQSGSDLFLIAGLGSGVDNGKFAGWRRTSEAALAYPLGPVFDHPIPPLYSGYTGTNLDQPVGCDLQAGPATTLCAWSPFPAFRPSGDPQWLRALADTLRTLADEVGLQNVAVFSTLEHGGVANPDLRLPAAPLQHPNVPVNRSEGFLHVTRLVDGAWSPGQEHRFPLRELDDLGLHLERYGAVLLLGDNATTTFSDRSLTLNALSPSPGNGLPDDAAWPTGPFAGKVRTPTSHTATPLAMQHHERLFEILRAAPDSGIRVVGTIGPAAGTLALSGMDLEGRSLTGWVNPGIPELAGFNGALRCAADTSNAMPTVWGTPAGYDPALWGPLDIHLQPKPVCKVNPDGPTGPQHDFRNAWNYWYWSAADAQTLALQNFLAAAGARFTSTQVTGFGDTCPAHPENLNPFSGTRSCIRPEPVHTDLGTTGHPTLVTAANEGDAGAWARAALAALHATGALPEGSAQWQVLDPGLTISIGSHFVRDATGDDHYDGTPMQVRIAVRSDASDPQQPGHGWFLLDRLMLLGTNNTRDVGVRIVSPQDFLRDGVLYQPGESAFHVTLEVSNRGTQDLGHTSVDLGVTQTLDCDGACIVSPQAPRTVQLDGLPAGHQRIVTLGGPPLADGISHPSLSYESQGEAFFAGQFPKAAGEPVALRFEARLGSSAGEDEIAFNDADEATARAGTVVSQLLHAEASVRLEPNQATRSEVDGVTVFVELLNDGSIRRQRASVDVEVRAASPSHCWFNNGKHDNGFWPCADGQAIVPERLWGAETQWAEVPRGARVTVPVHIDLDEAGLDAGIYRLTAIVRTQAPDGTPLPDRVVAKWLHLGTTGPALDTGRPVYSEAASVADSDDLADPDLDGDGAEDADSFFEGALCMQDATTREGGPDGTNFLVHGWRLSSDDDTCGEFMDSEGPPVVEWRRSDEGSVPRSGDEWDHLTSDQNPPTTVTRGTNDFGPDPLTWHPMRGGETFARAGSNGPALSLAAFEPGKAALALTTQYQSGPGTVYVVQMQVPTLSCTTNQNGVSACRWAWTQGWFTLSPEDDQGQAFLGPGTLQANCVPVQLSTPPKTHCVRIQSNPLSGLPGLWGRSALAQPGEPWPLVRYPIEATAFDPSLGASLADYCNAAGLGDFIGQAKGYTSCQYAPARIASFVDVNEGSAAGLPRPVRFRFLAASSGEDWGLNVWQIKDIALSEHHIQLDGPREIPVRLLDGESMSVPITIRNSGAVDDVVRVAVFPETPLPSNEVRVGLAHRSRDPPQTHLDLAIASGETRKVWVNVSVSLQTGLQAGIQWNPRLRVEATSLVDATAYASAVVNATFMTRPWADIEMEGLAVDGDTDGTAHASKGVPVSLTARFSNRGNKPIGGPDELILLRFVVKGEDGATHTIATTLVDRTLQPCRGHTLACTTFETVEWTPAETGLHEIQAILNPFEPGHPALPENDYDDNRAARAVQVGPVRSVDLLPGQAWVVPFDAETGCDQDGPSAQVLVAGHAYCVVALVRNQGQAPAKGAQVQFSVDASDPFSFASAPRVPDPFPGDHTALVASSPWTAHRRTDGTREREIHVQVFTTGSNTALQPFFSFQIPVEQYRLAVNETEPRAFSLLPGEQLIVPVNVTNTGTAITTPVGVLGRNASGLSVHLEQSAPLLPGERATLRLVVSASRSLQSEANTTLAEVFLSTLEDPRLSLRLPLEFKAAPQADGSALALPLRSAPGPVEIEVAFDNADAGWAIDWRAVSADAPLQINASTHVRVPAFNRALARLPGDIDAQAAPGLHVGNLTLRSTAEGVERLVPVTYRLVVDAAPAFGASLPTDRADAIQGHAAAMTLRLANLGNVPLEVAANHTVDHGEVRADQQTLRLAPGAWHNVTLRILGDGSLRSIGNSNITWRPAGEDWRQGPALPWSAEFQPAVVRIAATDLGELQPRLGRIGEATVVIENPARTTVETEVILMLDGIAQSRRTQTLEPGGQHTLRMPFQPKQGGMLEFLAVARPANSTLGLDDPAFYDSGDAVAHHVRVENPGFLDRMTPALPLPLLLAALAALAIALRRRVVP